MTASEPDPQHESIRITLLGGCIVEKNAVQLQFSYAKVAAILSYLVLERRPVGRESLALLFWPHMDGAQGRANLRLALHALRQALGNAVLGANRETIWLEKTARVSCDAWDFLAAAPRCKANRLSADCQDCFPDLRAAVDLYRGEFMAGFCLEDCPEFEDWLHIKRRVMHRQALGLIERTIACAQEAGNPGLAIQLAERFTALEPWVEDGHRRLMSLLADAGQFGAAMAHYEVLCEVLARELGSVPSQATRLLYESLQQTPALPTAALHGAEAPAAAPRAVDSGRVTVLYCELRSLLHPPEEAAEALRRAQSICQARVEHHGGYVTPIHGGVLAYFGFPEEFEGSASAALHCAYDIIATLTPAALAWRIGVHAGQIVYGGAAHPDLFGEVSAIAVRLVECGRTGDVLISSVVCSLLDESFSCQPVARQTVYLAEAGLQAFRVSPQLEAATMKSAPSALLGRQREQAQLAGLWQASIQGSSSAVLLLGEPGLGKSALAAWLAEHVQANGGVVRQMHCRPQHKESFLLPLIELMMRRCCIQAADSTEVRQEKLDRFLRDEHPDAPHDAAAVMAIMLGIVVPTTSMDYSPGLARERAYVAMHAMLASLARRQPLLLVIEDVHWADLSSMEWLGRLVASPPPGVLMLMTGRPEFAAPWREQLTQLPLHALPAKDAASLLDNLSAGALEPERIAQIVKLAEGVPLFLEQLGRAAQDGQLGDGQLPASLREVIGVRLGKLGSARRLAQIAATIGREFDLALLEAAAEDATTDAFFTNLRHLEKHQLIHINERRHGVFNHGLIRDVAYDTQPRSVRRETHRRILESWLLLHPNLSERHPEWLAHHYAESGDHENAVICWQSAGHRALAAAAYADAAMHFRTAIGFLQKWPPTPALDRWMLTITSALGVALVAKQGYGSPEARAVFGQALELSSGLDDDADSFRPLFGLWLGGSSHAGYQASLRLALRLERAAMRSDQPVHALFAAYACGNNYTWLGDFETARAYLERAVDLYRNLGSTALVAEYGEDPGVTCQGFLSWVYWFMGDADQARQAAIDGLQLARQLQHPFSLGFMLTFSARMHQLMGNAEAAMRDAAELIGVAERHGFPLWQAAGYLLLGWSKAVQGDESGVAMAEQTLPIVSQVMPSIEVTFLSVLADIKYRLGHHEEVIQITHQALQRAEEWHDFYMRAELLRLAAHSHRSLGREAEAERLLAKALAVSQVQGALVIEQSCREVMTFNEA
jgi:DNA-binding SARP family transcriptional activator/tetratricopeptide (TPR) repeat protein